MFILIFEQLLKMFFIMVLAFVCFKIGLVDQTGNKTVSNLLLLVVNPVLIITVYQTKYDPALVRFHRHPADRKRTRRYRCLLSECIYGHVQPVFMDSWCYFDGEKIFLQESQRRTCISYVHRNTDRSTFVLFTAGNPVSPSGFDELHRGY